MTPDPAPGSAASRRPRLLSPAREDSFRSRLLARDERALSELVELVSPWLLGLVQGMLGDQDEAEEVVIESFRVAWERIQPARDGDYGLVPWLLGIARNRAIDRIRARKRRRRLGDRLATVGSAPSATPPVEPNEAAQPGWHVHAAVHRALAELPDDRRQAVQLAYFEGHTHSEIAERLAIPLGTVKTRLRLGLGQLREQLVALKDWVA